MMCRCTTNLCKGRVQQMVRKRITESRQTTHRNRRRMYRPTAGCQKEMRYTARSPLASRSCRCFTHMGRIFEDNSKADGTLYGLRIDRKRRRELQRKRLAMGHKPDDHEEISHT